MGVSEFTTIILFVISCVSIIINVVTFIKNGNKDVKKDTSEDSYKWGRLDERLNNLEKQVNKILDKLDTFEIEIDTKIEKALDNHIKQYHEKHESQGFEMLRDEIEELKGSVETMEKEVKEQTLALEMLSELKKTTKRWFVVSIILLIALVGTNVAWLIYESSFETVYEDSTQKTQYTDNSTITQSIEQENKKMGYAKQRKITITRRKANGNSKGKRTVRRRKRK